MSAEQHRAGDVVERMFDGRAVRHWPESERFYCMAYPCSNTTQWFYLPAWSHLCSTCMDAREAARQPQDPSHDH
jgi:hypothetical protein